MTLKIAIYIPYLALLIKEHILCMLIHMYRDQHMSTNQKIIVSNILKTKSSSILDNNSIDDTHPLL